MDRTGRCGAPTASRSLTKNLFNGEKRMQDPSQPRNNSPDTSPAGVSRRSVLRTSTALAIGAAAASALNFGFPSGVHAAGDGTLKVGLVGCGGRGSGAAGNSMHGDANAKIVALRDAFKDKAEATLKNLKLSDVAKQVDVGPDKIFDGLDAYKKVIEASDVVLLATPPHFRPMHLKAVIEAGKHVFCEKPVAVDAPGVR